MQAGVSPVIHKQSHNLHRQARMRGAQIVLLSGKGSTGAAACKLVADRHMREVWPHGLILQCFVFQSW